MKFVRFLSFLLVALMLCGLLASCKPAKQPGEDNPPAGDNTGDNTGDKPEDNTGNDADDGNWKQTFSYWQGGRAPGTGAAGGRLYSCFPDGGGERCTPLL